jgi:hypothetical protein
MLCRSDRFLLVKLSRLNLCREGEARMATILSFIRAAAHFDDETTRLLGEAFDAARAALHDRVNPKAPMKSSPSALSRPQRRASVKSNPRDAGLAALGDNKDAIYL